MFCLHFSTWSLLRRKTQGCQRVKEDNHIQGRLGECILNHMFRYPVIAKLLAVEKHPLYSSTTVLKVEKVEGVERSLDACHSFWIVLPLVWKRILYVSWKYHLLQPQSSGIDHNTCTHFFPVTMTPFRMLVTLRFYGWLNCDFCILSTLGKSTCVCLILVTVSSAMHHFSLLKIRSL